MSLNLSRCFLPKNLRARREKMVHTCVDYLLVELEMIQKNSRFTFLTKKGKIQALQIELRFLKMFFWCFETWNVDMGYELHSCAAELSNRGPDHYISKISVSNLLKMVDRFKPKIREKCIDLLDRSISIKVSNTGEIVEFLDFILENLKYVIKLKANISVCVKKQITAVEKKIRFFRDLADYMATRCKSKEKLADFFIHIQAWANTLACLSCLYWMDHIVEKAPDVMGRVRAGSKSMRSDALLMYELVNGFADLFLQNLTVPKADYVEGLRDGLNFLLTFIMDPPEEHSKDGTLILTPSDATVSEATSLMSSLYQLEIEEGITEERNTHLFNILERIEILKAEVRHLYVQIPKPLQSNSPVTNALGFIHSLTGNLSEMLNSKADFIPFAKHQVMTVQGQLESLLPFLKDIMELKNKYQEIKDLWTKMINVAYHVEHVTDSCYFKDRPIWYNIICLSDVIEETELIKLEVEKIKNIKIYNIGNVTEEMDFSHTILPPANTSRINEVVVGFKKDAEMIIDRLIRGPTQLDIISIVGMPGQGKTTLAKKVYNDLSIQYHFHKCAWCCVSQAYQRRKLMLGILSDIVDLGVNSEITRMSDDELAERLRKYLKGQRYLIVIDDIWDIRAWHDLKNSFPDDKNGSRIMLTSRIQNVALQVKPNCNPYHLCPLSYEESWELLKVKVELKDDCPSDLFEVGNQIVKFCKGLPLAIVVISGLLGKMPHHIVGWWKQTVENLDQLLASERCMSILELSYFHLPDHLKPCFLYFGILPEDKVIRVQKLIKLWIAEGFVPRTKTKNMEDVAEEYLMDLIDRNLVTITRRNSNGRISACSIHDLFHDLCLAKAKEEHFFQLVCDYNRFDVSHFSLNPMKYDQYRLGIYSEWKPFIESRPTGPRTRSLLIFAKSCENMCQSSRVSSLFSSFKHLRVLDFGSLFFGDCFPEAINVLVLLRYLEVGGVFMHVPSSIVNLQNLETLIVKSVRSVHLPSTIWMMKNLRHVDLKPDVELPWDDLRLSNIETLSSVRISRGIQTQLLMTRFPKLRKLSCIFENSPAQYQKPSQYQTSDFFRRLVSLKVHHWGASGVEHNQIKKFSFPETLRKLTFSRFCLPWSAISTIRQLPNLEVLKLREDAFIGPKWDMEDEQFSNLKFLELYSLNLEKWNVSTESFPCLERLVLRHCNRLEEIPPCLGDICTLRMIEVRWCSKDATSSARGILNEQHDMGNEDLQVLIS